jgi:DNA-binding MarR family transcriptional regulator
MMREHRNHSHLDPDLILRAISMLRRLAAATSEWQRTQIEEGFTVNQALVLHHLVSHGDATPSDLADWMHISRGSVTPTGKRLEDLGLVSRRIDEQDGRKQWLTATREAHEIAAEVEKQALHPILAVFAHWSSPDLARFCDDLAKFLSSPVFGGKA